MDEQNQEIENKLLKLESSLKESEGLAARPAETTPVTVESGSTKSELFLLIGITLVFSGFLLFLNHIQISSSLGSMFGFGHGGVGLILMLLLAGMGMLFYDYKMKLGWIFTAAAAVFLFFTVLSSLQILFPMTSLLGVIVMLLPLAIGAALIAKGMAASDLKKKRGN